VYTGQPPVLVPKLDPTDPCNNLKDAKESLKSACSCQKASNDYSDQVRLYNTANEQYQVNLQYYNTLQQDRNDYEKKIGDYKSWGDKQSELQGEQLFFKQCQGKLGYSQDQWEYTCVKDYGNGWEYVKGSDTMASCGLYSRGKCRRTNAQVIKDLNDAGYKLWAPPSYSAPSPPSAPASTPITCCSQSFDNIQTGAGGKVVIQGVSQTCKTEINKQIKDASKPDEAPEKPADEGTAPPAEEKPAANEVPIEMYIAGGAAIVIVIAALAFLAKGSAATTAAASASRV
jgi:hypothetical protein